MNLAEIIEGHKTTIHGPARNGRRSYIPTLAEARRADEKKYGGKLENEERIRRNKEKDEQRLKELEILRLQDELDRKQWEWAKDMRSPSPRRPDSRQEPEEVFYRDGRRELPSTEIFGGPRRDHQQRLGTSSGSHPSRPRFTDFWYCLPSTDEEEEQQERSQGIDRRRSENGRSSKRERGRKGKGNQSQREE